MHKTFNSNMPDMVVNRHGNCAGSTFEGATP